MMNIKMNDGENKNMGLNNMGSATIFMVLLLIPVVAFLCMIIRYAQLAAAKGMAADAANLGNNAIYASYNQPMRDAYGIYCYTKTPEEMTDIAVHHMSKSMSVDADVNAVVVYQGDSLSNDQVFSDQIVKYMNNWHMVCGPIDDYQLLRMMQIREKAVKINEKFQEDYNRAVNSTYVAAPEESEENNDNEEETDNEGNDAVSVADATTARENAVAKTDGNCLELDFNGGNNEDKPNYNNSVSIIDSELPVISYENATDVNVCYGMKMIGNATDYIAPVEDAFYSKLSNDTSHKVSLYAYNNFSSFYYYGRSALTGNYYSSGDVVSISPWGESEFLLNGTDSDTNNAHAVKRMIFNVLFMEYVTVMYDTCMNNSDIQEYAEVLSGGNPDRVELIKDEFLIGVSAQLAYESLLYTYGGGENLYVTFGRYPYYMEFFLMLEVQRDYQGMLNRMRYIITENMHNPASSAEAREFNFDSAYLMPTIDSYHVDVTPSFGGVMSFEGR